MSDARGARTHSSCTSRSESPSTRLRPSCAAWRTETGDALPTTAMMGRGSILRHRAGRLRCIVRAIARAAEERRGAVGGAGQVVGEDQDAGQRLEGRQGPSPV